MIKKLTGTGLMIVLAMLLCIAAWAAQPVSSGIYAAGAVMHDFMTAQGDTVTPVNVEGFGTYYPSAQRFSVTYSDAQVGEQYLLVVVAGSTAVPGGAETVYIDQMQATSATLSFRVFPKALQEGSYSVYLTGGGRKLSDGALTTFSYHSSLVQLSGTAVSWSKYNAASYFLYDAAVDDVAILADMALETPQLALDYPVVTAPDASTAATGWQTQTFSFSDVDAGTYKLAVSKNDCRPQIQTVDLSRGNCTGLRVNLVTLVAGDLNGTGNKDATDMQCIYTYLSTGEILGNFHDDENYYLTVADLNDSGDVNILDYQWLYELLKSEQS